MVTKRKKLKILCVIFFLMIVFFVGAMKILAINSPGTGYAVPNGADNYAIQYLQVGETYARCGYVDNNTGQTLFIGTKTSAEWVSFKYNEPSGAYGCDSGSSANAGLTSWPMSTVCGSWDWNCDGIVTKQNTKVGASVYPCFLSSQCISGFILSGPPACGGEQYWADGNCIFFQCWSWMQQQGCH